MEVSRISEDGLSRQIWRFSVMAPHADTGAVHLIVKYYGLEKRPTTRSKFRADPATRYDFSDRRRYNSGISDVDVPLPDDVAAEAAGMITVSVHPAATDRRFLS